jgi:hypothetical protein
MLIKIREIGKKVTQDRQKRALCPAMAKYDTSWFQDDNPLVESHCWWVCTAKFNLASMTETDSFWL